MISATIEERRCYDRKRQHEWRNGIGKEKWRLIQRRYLSKPEVKIKRVRRATEWREKNPEKHRAYIERTKNHQKEYHRRYRQENKERLTRLALQYRANPENRKRLNAAEKIRKAKTPELTKAKARFYAGKRNALKQKCTVNLASIKQFMARTLRKKLVTCYYCEKQFPPNKIHFDHMIPLSKGGIHAVENLCTSCVTCNETKKARLIQEWVRFGQQVFPI